MGSHPNFDMDCGYYKYTPDGPWLAGKFTSDHAMGRMSRKSVEEARNADFRDSDILLATYPKTGQTWCITILDMIQQIDKLRRGDDLPQPDIIDAFPFLELEQLDGETGAQKLAKLTCPQRVIKCHLPYELMKDNVERRPNMKIIQTLRNPKDCLVSYYHHMRADEFTGPYNGTWDQYFELIKEKKLCWGDYFEHNAAWYKFNKRRSNSLIIRYESMKSDPRSHVIKLAEFAGHKLSDSDINLIVEKSSFKNMAPKLNEPDPAWRSERSNFARRGIVGDYKNYISNEQAEYLDQQCKIHLEPLGIYF